MTRQKTEHHTVTRTQQPRGLTGRFAQRRRRFNPHRTWGHLDASSRQPRGSATICPPPALDKAPPPPPGLSASDIAPPPELPDRGTPATPLDMAYAAARAQLVLDDANKR